MALALFASAANWPAWRGPHGDGVCDEKSLPVKGSRTGNVRWHVALPGPGNSTPIVWGRPIFLTQGIGADRMLLCLDHADGHELWRAGVKNAPRELTRADKPFCAGSTVTDGERVIVSFGSDGALFIRAYKGLWFIGRKQAKLD